MKRIPKALKIAALVCAVALLFVQFIRIEMSNPPVRADLASGPVKPVLQKSCYSCHSNETVWPWYSGVAPASWLVGRDVHEGRGNLNFSDWGNYDRDTRVHKLRDIADEVKEGAMPLWYYTLFHREARLSASGRDQILGWVAESLEAEKE